MGKKHSREVDDVLRRRLVLNSPCPFCNAQIGEKCIGANEEKRVAAHQSRWDVMLGKELSDPRAIQCPVCGVLPGTNCQSPNGHVRQTNHAARRTEYKKLNRIKNG